MDERGALLHDSELIFRRLLETPSGWALFFPVGLALLVLLLVLFFRQPESAGALLRRAGLPGGLLRWLNRLWGLSSALLLGLGGWYLYQGQEIPAAGWLWGGLALASWPLLAGLLLAVMLFVTQPRALVALGMVLALGLLYLALGTLFLPVFGWYLLLVPVLLVALAYVVLMYARDAQSIHPLWAAFLALLRCLVYGILAAVFLLPGCQTYQTSEIPPKVLVLIDVSGSMRLVDDLPQPGQDPRRLPSRLDKVLRQLTAPDASGQTFLNRLQDKSPLTLYRFGGVLDEWFPWHTPGDLPQTQEQWRAWLYPERQHVQLPPAWAGRTLSTEERQKWQLKYQELCDDLVQSTNISGAALTAVTREAGHLLQAVILFSDGRNNAGSAETFRELQVRAQNPKRPFALITVGVGEYREPVAIRLEDLSAPQQARPDDKFPVRVTVVGDGLRGEPFHVTLEAVRVVAKGQRWEPIPGDRFVLSKEGRFDKGDGEHPYGEVEFEVDIRKERGIAPGDDSKDDQVEGTWEFRAHVPRHPREAFAEAEHVSQRPARVLVQKRKLRVLLFAGGPTREYQLLRTLFYREVQEKRMELSIYLQSAPEKDVDQDVEPERLLTHFPDRLGSDAAGQPYYSLSDYDVLVAFDPDWSRLEPAQIKLLRDWVTGPSAGGFIFVAGPVNSYQLARPGGQDLTPLLEILPVVLKDSRLHSLGLEHDARRPYLLRFPERARQYDFLNLEEDAAHPLSGWEKFFWGSTGAPEPGKDVSPLRGFYNYYPVERLRPDSDVLATFVGPPASRINDGKDEQPFLVTLRAGAGRSVYISAGEIWRLRQYNTSYYQRFWVKLARYVASGSLSKLSRYGLLLVPSQVKAGLIKVEAQVLGADLKPLPPDARPLVKVIRPPDFDPKVDRETPESFELKAKPSQGEWHGYFAGSVRISTPGEYILRLPIPGTSQSLEHTLVVLRPDPETEITRPDHSYLYQLASSARPVLQRFSEAERRRWLRLLQPPAASEPTAPADKESAAVSASADLPLQREPRLYFPLNQAQYIPDLLVKLEPIRESTKGRLQDLWDQGVQSGWTLRADYFLLLLAGTLSLLAGALFAYLRQWLAALLSLLAGGAVAGGIAWLTWGQQVTWAELPLDLSFVLGAVVALLGLEWLLRKLLKLA